MRDLLSWNIYLGRWAGVHVRLHVLFVLLAVAALHAARRSEDHLLGYVAVSLVILLTSVLLHELAHCFAARRIGESADQILMWPFGGLLPVNLVHEPRHELITALAGPIANLFVCVIAAPVLLMLDDGNLSWRLLNPLVPPPGTSGIGPVNCLQMAFWINWLLVVVNLLPAFPLDGGRILRAALWPRFGHRTAVQLVSRAAKVTALLIWVLAWVVSTAFPYAPIPLVILGVFLFYSARTESNRTHEPDRDEGPFGYDFSAGYTSLERAVEPGETRTGPLRRWIERRREARRLRQLVREEAEDRRVDDILARMHETGLDGLSAEERALLHRASARYRSRPRG